jgi:phage terminase large subunit-like protein
MNLELYARDVVAFFDHEVKVNERGEPFRLFPHQREILAAAFAFGADGKLPWDTFIYSAPKKSGKTTINGGLAAWWAYTQEAPNEVYVLANDLEQAQARAYSTAARLIAKNPGLVASAKVEGKRIAVTNGTEIRPLSSEYAGAAGSNHGFTSWDELWAYTSEASRRLWEELTPVPTRRNSVRLITTYAGFEGESKLLWDLYLAGVGKDEHRDGQGERIHPTLPLWLNREARLLVYWDHEARMPWQTQEYYRTQKKTLRPGTFLRLHENRWAVAESAFIPPETWDACVEASWSPLWPTKDVGLFVGVDAATKHDTAAVVSVLRDEGDGLIVLASHRIWKPTPEDPLDLEATVEAHLRELDEEYRVAKVYVDPYQMARSIATLKAAGLPVEEFAQTPANTNRMGQCLFDLLNGKNLVLYPDDELRQQALNTVALESARGWRLAKERQSRKIDAIVALSMACVAALSGPAQDPPRIW